MNRLLWEYFFLLSAKLFFKKKSSFLRRCPCASAKAAELSPPGNKSLLYISAICHLLLRFVTWSHTAELLTSARAWGWPQVGEDLTELENCRRWAGMLAFSALLCLILHSGSIWDLSHSPQKRYKAPSLPRERRERSGALLVFLGGRCPLVSYLCWFYCSKPSRSMETCTARIIQAHFKTWWDS